MRPGASALAQPDQVQVALLPPAPVSGVLARGPAGA